MEDDESNVLNKSTSNLPHINRGVELLLRNKRRKPEQPKFFQVKFGKVLSFFRREIHLYLDFSLDFRKADSSGEE
jgi:hypothetical protein